MENASIEMPKYVCHKTVHALKIAQVYSEQNGEVRIRPEDERYDVFFVAAEWAAKHNPQDGGYYVVYEDGYASYSPSAAFESGYTLAS